MIRLILAAATLSLAATSADAAIVCHDARHHVIKCVRKPIYHRVVTRRVYVHHYRHTVRCHDTHGRWIVCRR